MASLRTTGSRGPPDRHFYVAHPGAARGPLHWRGKESTHTQPGIDFAEVPDPGNAVGDGAGERARGARDELPGGDDADLDGRHRNPPGGAEGGARGPEVSRDLCGGR